jgi:hypothetical protein
VLAAPFFIAAGLLVVSGVGKLVRPAGAASALRSAGLPGGRVVARALGLVEVAVGAAALWRPGPATAAAVVVLYLGFAAFLVRLLRLGGATSCGCVGAADAPPSRLHVALDLVAAAVAAGVAVWPVPSVPSAVAGSPLAGVPLVIGLVGAGALLAVAVVEVPRAWRSYRPAHNEHSVRIRGPRPISLVERPR